MNVAGAIMYHNLSLSRSVLLINWAEYSWEIETDIGLKRSGDFGWILKWNNVVDCVVISGVIMFYSRVAKVVIVIKIIAQVWLTMWYPNTQQNPRPSIDYVNNKWAVATNVRLSSVLIYTLNSFSSSVIHVTAVQNVVSLYCNSSYVPEQLSSCIWIRHTYYVGW